MILRRLAVAVNEQNWFTVVLEVLIVVVGIFIGLQVDDWNQARKDRAEITEYLERIQIDLSRDAEFFAFLEGATSRKRQTLATLKRMIGRNQWPDEDPDAILDLLTDSITIGFEFPEVQTVTFFDLQSSGKLALVEDAGLRRQLSFYYQESLHRSDRIESRITGYAAAIYEMVDPEGGLISRDVDFRKDAPSTEKDKSNPAAIVGSFLAAARKERFLDLLTAEQNYTEFMSAQINLQLEETRALQQAVGDAVGKPGR